MKIWLKILFMLLSIFLICLFLVWWMNYEPLKIEIKNERNETVSLEIRLLTLDNYLIFNKSISLNENESITIENVTNMARNYYIEVRVGNESKREKITYGKYHEKIEILIGEEISIKK
ncbi:MAG: hypothetical protein H5T44_04855 [Thermoplasmatales archaeon]|nr:hypothetical protein [Thermoplasmatales archaeon]